MIEFILNNQTIRTEQSPAGTLLDFVRYHKNLVGTKIGCREGDCGACTVLIGELMDGKMQYRSMTSCLTPLGNAQGKHVVTIEGLNMEVLTPVQQAFTDCSATQCGFCTVGFVVSLTGYCMTSEQPETEKAIGAMDGNICRCTGYKSIESAGEVIAGKLKSKDNVKPIEWLVEHQYIPDYFNEIPTRLSQIEQPVPVEMKAEFLLGGGTDLYVQRPEQVEESEVGLLFDHHELQGIEVVDNKCIIGAACTATDLLESDVMQKAIPNLYRHLKLVSSTPIRNMGTVAGNFVNASPIGDLTAFFLGLNAKLHLRRDDGNMRAIALKDFYQGYKVIAKADDEIIHSIEFELPDADTKFSFEKVSKRTYLDIATVNSAASITVVDAIVQSIHASAGGVGPTPIYLSKTCEFLKGKQLSTSILQEALEVAQTEISPISDARGTAEYKRLLVRQLLMVHFVELFPELVKMEELV